MGMVVHLGNPRSKPQPGHVLVGAPSWFLDGCLLTVSSLGGGAEGPLWGLFYEGTDSTHGASTLMT